MSTRLLVPILGLAAGAVALSARRSARGSRSGRQPIGGLWLDAMTVTLVPLVFGLLVAGVGSARSSGAAGGRRRDGARHAWFVALLIAACALGPC
ncbi:hypothetical protein [Caulobacter segnis]